jgi:hypothetical protein
MIAVIGFDEVAGGSESVEVRPEPPRPSGQTEALEGPQSTRLPPDHLPATKKKSRDPGSEP